MSDFAQYRDLTLRDVDAIDIIAAARLRAQIDFPDLDLVPGSYEDAFLQVQALMETERIAAVNRLPTALMLGVAIDLFRIEPDIGASATVAATLTVSTSSGATIPAGQLVELDLGDGSPLRFGLLSDAVVPPGDTSVAGVFGALSFTAKANGIAAGATLRLVTAAPELSTVTTTGVVSGGRNPETVSHFLARAVGVFGNLSSTLTRASNFTNAALQQAYVGRATTIDRYDGAGGPPYTDNGHVTVVATGVSGNLTGPQKTALVATLEANTRVDLQVHVIDPTITPVSVTATVEVVPGYDASTVQTAVVAMLTAYLDANVWAWGGTVYRNVLVQRMANVDGVNRVVSISIPAADLMLPGDGPLASTGTLTISTV